MLATHIIYCLYFSLCKQTAISVTDLCVYFNCRRLVWVCVWCKFLWGDGTVAGLRCCYLVLTHICFCFFYNLLHRPESLSPSQVNQNSQITYRIIKLYVFGMFSIGIDWFRKIHVVSLMCFRFYHEKFKDFPRSRRSLIPFIFWEDKCSCVAFCQKKRIHLLNCYSVDLFPFGLFSLPDLAYSMWELLALIGNIWLEYMTWICYQIVCNGFDFLYDKGLII